MTSVAGRIALDRVLSFCKLGTGTLRVGSYCEDYKVREVRIDDLVMDAR